MCTVHVLALSVCTCMCVYVCVLCRGARVCLNGLPMVCAFHCVSARAEFVVLFVHTLISSQVVNPCEPLPFLISPSDSPQCHYPPPPKVGRAVFEEAICGALAHTTRLWVCNQLQFLAKVCGLKSEQPPSACLTSGEGLLSFFV